MVSVVARDSNGDVLWVCLIAARLLHTEAELYGDFMACNMDKSRLLRNVEFEGDNQRIMLNLKKAKSSLYWSMISLTFAVIDLMSWFDFFLFQLDFEELECRGP